MTVHVIFRIEDQDEVGVYCSGLNWELGVDNSPSGDRPGPEHDDIDPVDKADRFGFSSLSQLRRWFPSNRHKIPLNGSVVRKVYAMRVQYGRHQVAFDTRSVIQ